MATMTGGQALLRPLLAHGVDTPLGTIAPHTIHPYDTLHGLQPARRHVGGRLVLGLGSVAGGYARASGRPGVLVAGAGPGAVGALEEALAQPGALHLIEVALPRGCVAFR